MTTTRNTKKTTQTTDETGSYHMVECTGDGSDGSGCIVWSRIWLPERIPRNFMKRPFLCGFWANDTLKNVVHNPVNAKVDARFEADVIEQYGRRDNIRIVGLEDGGNTEDPYQEVVKVAQYCGVKLQKEDISICHRLPSRNGKRTLIARFVRREKKIEMMRNKKKLKEHGKQIYLNDDITPLRSRILFSLQRQHSPSMKKPFFTTHSMLKLSIILSMMCNMLILNFKTMY